MIKKKMNNKIAIVVIVLALVVAVSIYYYNQNQKPVGPRVGLAPDGPIFEVGSNKEVIQSKLKVYDIVASKNATEIRKMMLDFIGYALVEKKQELLTAKDKQFVNEEIDIINAKGESIKTMSDKDLVNYVYSEYQRLYGTRDNFKKDLEDPKTTFTNKTNTHKLIVLPNRSSGNNLEMRTLDSYFVDGQWK